VVVPVLVPVLLTGGGLLVVVGGGWGFGLGFGFGLGLRLGIAPAGEIATI
jgi:hypothetical protein